MILLDKIQGQDYVVQPPATTSSQEIAWRFFKNMGRQAGENAWIKTKQDYNEQLQKLENTFQALCVALQTKKSNILNLPPEHYESITNIINPSVRLESQLDAIYQTLHAFDLYINKSILTQNDYFENVQRKMSKFKDNYLNFQNSKKEYNEASVNMDYLQQPTLRATL